MLEILRGLDGARTEMSDWFHSLPVAWMALPVFGFTYFVMRNCVHRGQNGPIRPVGARKGSQKGYQGYEGELALFLFGALCA
jgi:hypothetical protein